MQTINQPKPIGQIVQYPKRNNSGTQESTHSSSIISPKIEALFLTLASILGGSFTGAFPTEKSLYLAKQLWQRHLEEFTDKELEETTDNVFLLSDDKPFNLKIFKNMCSETRIRNKPTSLPAYTGSSDRTNEQWKHWFHRTFGVMPVIASAKTKTNH